MSLLLGYNTNGFSHHRLPDALEIIAGLEYRSVGLTLDVHHNTYGQLKHDLIKRALLPVIETGARFLLDPRRKHRPTLMDDGRHQRLDFLLRCVDIAADLGAPCVSLWSGAGSDWGRLVQTLELVCNRADERGVDIAFEPEPGMLVDTMARFDELRDRLPHERLCLTLDVGHLHCLEEGRPDEWIDRYAPLLRNVHLDDHRRGVHDHLMFGEGEIDFPPVMQALQRAAKDRDLPATVELSRHSHDAVVTAQAAMAFLTSASGPAAS